MALNAQQGMLPVAQPVYPVQGQPLQVPQPVYGQGQVVPQPMMMQQPQPVMMQPAIQMMPMQPAPQPQVIIIQQQPAGPPPINIDRNDPDYLDAADVAGCWLQCCCAVFPVCSQFDAINPDEIGTPGYCWLGICCCNNSPTPIYQRVGPRRWGHPEGDLIFSSDSCVSDTSQQVDNGCKLCGPGPWSCFDPDC